MFIYVCVNNHPPVWVFNNKITGTRHRQDFTGWSSHWLNTVSNSRNDEDDNTICIASFQGRLLACFDFADDDNTNDP